MKCIVIDDEPMAIDIMERYIGKIASLELLHSFGDAIKALDFINDNQIDLIFLDINMPDITGIQFLQALKNPPLVIFTTAYSEYAIESYDYESVDYLLKPIAFTRFLKAVQKAQKRYKDSQKVEVTPISRKQPYEEKSNVLSIKSGTAIHRINENDILYVEGAGNYLEVVTKKEKVLTLYTMKEILSILDENKFVRIHKSYVVALNHIQKIERFSVFISDQEIPIGNTYKEMFLERIKWWG